MAQVELKGMREFGKAFALTREHYEQAIFEGGADVNRKLLKFFARNPKYKSESRRAKVYSYMQSGGLRRRLKAYMKAAAILTRLHAEGLVYGNFSDECVFVSEDCDCDQVRLIGIDETNFSELSSVGFYDDCFAFAGELFRAILNRHPFDGKAFRAAVDEEEDADRLRDNGEFAWILDDEDRSNDGRQFLIFEDSAMLTDGLRELFRQMFSFNACRYPIARPTMMQLTYETAFAFDNVIRSKNCGLDYVNSKIFSICPFDHLETPSVRLKSFLLDAEDRKSAMLWQFTHESEDETIEVPLRILNGFKCREPDEIAFILQFENGKIYFRSAVDDCVFGFRDGVDGEESPFRSLGGFCFSQPRFSIKCRDEKNGRRILIEGEIA